MASTDSPVPRSCAHALVATLFLALLPGSALPAGPDADIIVRVQKVGRVMEVDVDCPVDAPASLVWEVLTDYDQMARFISTLESSRVESRADNVLRVHQSGKASRGPLSLSFDNVREIELVPEREIRSHLVSGDMKGSRFVTRVVRVAERIHIVNSGRYTPNLWVPPVFGPALIEAALRAQFREFRIEILRRSAQARLAD